MPRSLIVAAAEPTPCILGSCRYRIFVHHPYSLLPLHLLFWESTPQLATTPGPIAVRLSMPPEKIPSHHRPSGPVPRNGPWWLRPGPEKGWHGRMPRRPVASDAAEKRPAAAIPTPAAGNVRRACDDTSVAAAAAAAALLAQGLACAVAAPSCNDMSSAQSRRRTAAASDLCRTGCLLRWQEAPPPAGAELACGSQRRLQPRPVANRNAVSSIIDLSRLREWGRVGACDAGSGSGSGRTRPCARGGCGTPRRYCRCQWRPYRQTAGCDFLRGL